MYGIRNVLVGAATTAVAAQEPQLIYSARPANGHPSMKKFKNGKAEKIEARIRFLINIGFVWTVI